MPGAGAELSRADQRRYLQASCYYHRDRMASSLCEYCGRALCMESSRWIGEDAYCPECVPGTPRPAYICGRCGWISLAPRGNCPECGAEEALLRRGGEPGRPYWEERFQGFARDDRLWAFGLAWLGSYFLGLAAASRLTLLGIAHSPAWWVFLGIVTCGCGAIAASIVRQSSRYEIVLSQDGAELRRRRKVAEFIRWGEVMGLEFVPHHHPTHLVIHGLGQKIVIDQGLKGWSEAVALIRQHAAVAPPPLPEGSRQ